MANLKQSTTFTRTFMMIQTSDHISGITGATVAVNISKAGATGAAAAGTVTEVDSTHNPGLYKIALTTADTGTIGDLAFHCTATSADPTDFIDQVTANILGDTLPANTTQIAGSAVSTASAQIGVNVVSYASGQAPLQPTVAARTLDISAAGNAGIDWANIDAPTTSQSLSGTTVATVTTTTTATNLTNAPTAGDFTATMKTSIGTAVAASAVASVTGAVGSVTGNVGGNVTGSVGSVSGNVGGNVTGSVGSVTAAVTVDGTSPMTEAYAAQGAALTLSKALYGLTQLMSQQSVAGTTLTTKKRDGSTTAKTYTLNDATTPTAISEAT